MNLQARALRHRIRCTASSRKRNEINRIFFLDEGLGVLRFVMK